MELQGLIHTVFDTQKVSEKFQTREMVLKTDFNTQYPQYVSLKFSQDKCTLLDDFRKDDFVKIQFNVRGREWNGPQGLKYFNTLDAWSISLIPKRDGETTTTTATTTPSTTTTETTSAPVFNASSGNDDLPF